MNGYYSVNFLKHKIKSITQKEVFFWKYFIQNNLND